MRLEDLRPGMRVRGVVAGRGRPGPDRRDADGRRRRHGGVRPNTTAPSTSRSSCGPTSRSSPGRGTADPFDADADEFKLAAEALRIRLEAAEASRSSRTARTGRCRISSTPSTSTCSSKIPLRFLLADDPGAGKTIMAGLFLRELELRGGLERCLIVAPGGLVEQWQQELRDKFGLDFDVLVQDDIRDIVAGGALFDRRTHLIARMDQVARNHDLVAVFRRTPWDVVIVDEAHRMSAHYGAGREVKTTQRYGSGWRCGTRPGTSC